MEVDDVLADNAALQCMPSDLPLLLDLGCRLSAAKAARASYTHSTAIGALDAGPSALPLSHKMLSDSCYSEESDLESDASTDQEVAFESLDSKEENAQGESTAWTVLEAADLARVQDEALAGVMNILGCSASKARALLIYFKWNKEALFGVLADRGEEHVCRIAGCTSQEQHDAAAETSGLQGNILCNICFCDTEPDDATAMECGHAFCNDCWCQHLKIQIQDGRARRLPCMQPRCGVYCDENKVKRLLEGQDDVLLKYAHSLAESWVDDNASVRWCPSVPCCGRAISVAEDVHCQPECRCGMRFCFACGDEPHSPCTCSMWKEWRKKCIDDSETLNWIAANSKPCPKCAKAVEKNGGCNLVVCKCGQSFCWLCGQGTGVRHTWTNIEGHTCGKYKDDAEAKISEAARNIKRFQHYQQRWEANVSSIKLEDKLRSKVAATIDQLEAKSARVDHAWLTQALDQLCDARRILGYSYAFAFYMFGNEHFAAEKAAQEINELHKDLFEDQQQMLQAEVEKLADQVATPPEQLLADRDDHLRLQVINCAVGIDRRFWKMFDVIENDLLGPLQSASAYIAPYKGRSTLRAGQAPADPPSTQETVKSPSFLSKGIRDAFRRAKRTRE
ncbi:hypothetical protein WJX73_007969 [Symbiochloris irregularis]|uniref:RBR-type E3 ubiquitin transferase n=1 Tax=Symbiochloris irregularis TaxID=706552 RepID=A0AAW1PEK0_9CHLO